MSVAHRIVVIDNALDLQPHLPALWDLHAQRLDDNLYASPVFARAILQHYAGPGGARLVLVYRHAGAVQELIGCAPFSAPRRRMSLKMLPGCDNHYMASSAPLLHRGRADEAAHALWSWLADRRRPWSLVCWDAIGLQTRTWRHLARAVHEGNQRWWVRYSFPRPGLQRRESFEAYLAALSSKRRATYRAGWRRLQRAGEVQVKLHRSLRDYDLVQRFLQLERAGWKGAQGTALACSGRDSGFFTDLTRAFGERNELYFVEIVCDGNPVAITVNFIDGTTMFGFKLAFAPEHRAAGPGIVNAFEVARLMHEDPTLQRLDSSAGEPGFLQPYWIDPSPVGQVLASTARLGGRVALRLLPAARRSRASVRGVASQLGPAGSHVG